MPAVAGSAASTDPQVSPRRSPLGNFGQQFRNFFLASLFFDLGMFVFAFLYNLYLLDRGLNEKTMGWIAAAGSLGTMLATIPAGMLARKIGLYRTLLSCFVAIPVVYAARALVQEQMFLVLLALIGGALFAVWAVSLPPTVASLTTEQNRSVAFSLIFALGIGSGILGGYLGGHLPAWCSFAKAGAPAQLKQWSLLLACAIVLAGILPCRRITIKDPLPSSRPTAFPRSRFLWRFLPPIAVWSFALGLLAPFLSIYMTKNLHLELTQIGSMFSLSQFLQMLSVLAAPRIFRRFGILPAVTFSQLATSISLAAFSTFSAGSWMLASYAAYSLFQYMNEPGIYTLLMNGVAPEEQSSASAWNFFVICAAQSVAALIAGMLLPRIGYPAVLCSAAALMGVSAVALYLSIRQKPDSAQKYNERVILSTDAH